MQALADSIQTQKDRSPYSSWTPLGAPKAHNSKPPHLQKEAYVSDIVESDDKV